MMLFNTNNNTNNNNEWLKRHKKNLLYNIPTVDGDLESDDDN